LRCRGVIIPEEGSSRHLLEDLLDDLAFAKSYVDRVSLSLLQGVLKPLQVSNASNDLDLAARRTEDILNDVQEIFVEIKNQGDQLKMPAGLERDLQRSKEGCAWIARKSANELVFRLAAVLRKTHQAGAAAAQVDARGKDLFTQLYEETQHLLQRYNAGLPYRFQQKD
jgi:hypothetical protein